MAFAAASGYGRSPRTGKKQTDAQTQTLTQAAGAQGFSLRLFSGQLDADPIDAQLVIWSMAAAFDVASGDTNKASATSSEAISRVMASHPRL